MKDATSYSDLAEIVRGSMTSSSRDEEVAQARVHVVEAQKLMKTTVEYQSTLEQQLIDVDNEIATAHKHLSECISVKQDLEALIATSVDEVDEQYAEVMSLKEAMTILRETKVVSMRIFSP